MGAILGFGPLAPRPFTPFQGLQGEICSNFVSLQSFFSNIFAGSYLQILVIFYNLQIWTISRFHRVFYLKAALTHR